MDTASPMTLGRSVRDRLRSFEPRRTQKWLAGQLGITEADLSKRLNTQKIMEEEVVVRLACILDIPLNRLLLLSLIAGCDARTNEIRKKSKAGLLPKKSDAEKLRTNFEKARIAYHELLQITGTVEPKVVETVREYISLEDFPNMVPGTWTVLVGDRREEPPQGLGDLIGMSVSASDFMFLHRLSLPPKTTVMRSDKTILIASNRLKELLKTNLLVIGSPAVSLAARRILCDSGATFMFNINNEEYDKEHHIYDSIGEHPSREQLNRLISEHSFKSKRDDLLATFRKNGFMDPVNYSGIRGRAIAQHEDYGMVALARNPWSEDHIVCICAGVHGGGTAGAIELLTSPSKFENHPWGGVFKVSLSDQIPWENRFENLAPRLETKEYSPEKYLEYLDKLIMRFDSVAKPSREDYDLARLEVSKKTLECVRQFSARLAEKRRWFNADDTSNT